MPEPVAARQVPPRPLLAGADRGGRGRAGVRAAPARRTPRWRARCACIVQCSRQCVCRVRLPLELVRRNDVRWTRGAFGLTRSGGQCTSLYVEPMAWMGVIGNAEVQGKLNCPCGAKLGAYNWSDTLRVCDTNAQADRRWGLRQGGVPVLLRRLGHAGLCDQPQPGLPPTPSLGLSNTRNENASWSERGSTRWIDPEHPWSLSLFCFL